MRDKLAEHILVPKHEILDAEEAEKILAKYRVTRNEMPKIMYSDPALKDKKHNIGDIVKITRKNPLIGESIYYRVVVD